MFATSVAEASPAAEKLFQDGRAALAAGKLDDACDAFRRSEELEPRVGTLLNLADCEERRGHLASAWSAFVDARALATRQNDPRVGEADHRAAALAPKLSYVKLSVPPIAGLVVKRDGQVVTAELDHEVPLDPGTYKIEAVAPGRQPRAQTVTVAIGAHVSVDVPALDVDPVAAPA